MWKKLMSQGCSKQGNLQHQKKKIMSPNSKLHTSLVGPMVTMPQYNKNSGLTSS